MCKETKIIFPLKNSATPPGQTKHYLPACQCFSRTPLSLVSHFCLFVKERRRKPSLGSTYHQCCVSHVAEGAIHQTVRYGCKKPKTHSDPSHHLYYDFSKYCSHLLTRSAFRSMPAGINIYGNEAVPYISRTPKNWEQVLAKFLHIFHTDFYSFYFDEVINAIIFDWNATTCVFISSYKYKFKAHPAYTRLNHLWRPTEISPKLEARVHYVWPYLMQTISSEFWWKKYGKRVTEISLPCNFHQTRDGVYFFIFPLQVIDRPTDCPDARFKCYGNMAECTSADATEIAEQSMNRIINIEPGRPDFHHHGANGQKRRDKPIRTINISSVKQRK